MSGEDDASKTEDPTEKKLNDARNRGQVAKSQEFNHWMILFGSLIFVMAFLPGFFREMGDLFAGLLNSLHQYPAGDEPVFGLTLADIVIELGQALMIPAFIMLALAALAGIIQFGLLFAPEAIKPKPSKISPLSGFKRIFGTQGMMEFAKGLLKLVTVTIVAAAVLWPEMNDLERFIYLPPPELMRELHELAILIFIGVLVVMSFIAALDFIYQKWKHFEDMRMTKQEVKDEKKQTQGDPQVKQRLAELRQEKAKKRMAQEVPNADAVVTNPTHYAVALVYREAEMDAPMVTAKGVDNLALRLREIAEENDVPIVENPPLAQALYDTVEIDEHIKPEHYQAVAEVISYVYRLRGEQPGAG